MEQIYNFILHHIPATAAGVFIVVSTFFEVSKIPLNPWSAIAKMFKKALNSAGDALTKDIKEQLNEIRTDLTELRTEYRADHKESLRQSILRFADECRIKQKHSKEMFSHILRSIDKYSKMYKDITDLELEEAVRIIKEANHECFKNNTYL